MIGAALRFIGLRGGLAIALALVAALSWHKWGAWKQEAADWREAAAAWRNAFDAQKASYVAAQAAARARAEAKKAQEAATYRTLAERADYAEQEIARYRALADRYARANRLRKPGTGAAAGAAGGADRAGAGAAAQGAERSGDDAAVVVERADFDALVENTIRLKRAHDWGEALVAEGLAARPEGD
jgi:hypothetical protein